MTAHEDDFQQLVERARETPVVDDVVLGLLVDQVSSGRISTLDGTKYIEGLLRGEELPVAVFTAVRVNVEWDSLMDGMREETDDWQKVARNQYRQGFWLLPSASVTVLVVTVLSIRFLHTPETAIATLAGAALAALAAHAFFVFRVHQQARIAAERLSEKRAASLFLRLALSRSTPEQAPQILAMAASMFLGHQAPATLPLQPEDWQRAKSS